MYDVSSRTIIIKSSTGEHVGPGTYVICNPRHHKESCAPFLSSQKLTNSFISKCNTDALYNITESKDKIIGGSSLRNKAARFVYKTDLTPGPTRYKPKPIQCSKKKLTLDPTKPKLYICAVPYAVTVVAPSIPTKSDENGYEIVDDHIVKLPPDKPISTKINIPSGFGGKGWKWSCRTSSRIASSECKDCGPGPAAYNLQVSKCRRNEPEEQFREMARLFTFIPRYMEAQEIKAAKESQPGPGYYEIGTNCMDHCTTYSKSIKPRPFLRSAPRFTSQNSDTPAPTDYEVCDCAKDKKFFSHKCAPFGAFAPRFKKRRVIDGPGPASYEIKGALEEKLKRKRNLYGLCDPPFNSTSVRKIGFESKDAAFTPSAAEYPEVKDDEEKETIPISSSVFMNNVCRFIDKTDSVEPAKYNISESFKKKQDRKSFNVSGIPFNVNGPRSITPEIKVGVPCPTSYDVELGLNCTGHHFNMSPRFTCPEETIGPGQYKIHPRYAEATYKSIDTNNLRLKENALHKKLRLAPRETRKLWMKTMKQKKLLKWFDIELDFEERMEMLIQELFDKPI